MKEVQWTFTEWLKRFENVDLPIGDFAKDVAQDANFPTEDNFVYILEHLTDQNVPGIVLETFASVWQFYVTTR